MQEAGLRRELEDESRARRRRARICATFLARCPPRDDRTVIFFPPAISLAVAGYALARAPRHPARRAEHSLGREGRLHRRESARDGARCGRDARARRPLGAPHTSSARRDEITAKKCAAAFKAGLTPVLCVGEKIEEREPATRRRRSCCASSRRGSAGSTPAQVAHDRDRVRAGVGDRHRSHGDARGCDGGARGDPPSAARASSANKDAEIPILYGGSVNADNARIAAARARGGRAARRRRDSLDPRDAGRRSRVLDRVS